MSWSSWRVALRIARRDALRHRGRSALIITMVMLPVLVVTAVAVLLATTTATSLELLDRRIGSAAALITVEPGIGVVEQAVDPDVPGGTRIVSGDAGRADGAATEQQISSTLGGADLLEVRRGVAAVATDDGRTYATTLETDLQNSSTDGLVDLTAGRFPAAADEVVVNAVLADEGYAIGDQLELAAPADGASDVPAAPATNPTVVGIAESPNDLNAPFAAGPLGSLGAATDAGRSWLVDAGPVSWTTVQSLNKIGATVLSRSAMENPPPTAQIGVATVASPTDNTQIVVLVVVMALLVVVLMAGSAFAVGARQQQRALALLAATGGTPRESRRVVMAGAVGLGAVATVAGVGLGIGAAAAVLMPLQSVADETFGPFEVPAGQVVGVAAFGFISALLAAAIPARLASRQQIVAVLAGRRGDRPPTLHTPILGLVLLAVGVLGSIYGAVSEGGVTIASFSGVPAVVGAILLVPSALAGLSRLSGRLPLSLRYAMRDAVRHRTRTVSAVAAVLATVAAAVALGIGLSNLGSVGADSYQARLPAGAGIVTTQADDRTPQNWEAFRGIVQDEVPDATVSTVQGLTPPTGSGLEASVSNGATVAENPGSSSGIAFVVSDDVLPPGLGPLPDDARTAAEAAVRSGRVAVFVRETAGPTAASGGGSDVEATLTVQTFGSAGTDLARTTSAAVAIEVPVTASPSGAAYWSGPTAIVPSAVAAQLGLEPAPVAITITGVVVSAEDEEAIQEGLADVAPSATVFVERGFQPDDSNRTLALVCLALAGLLVLGGTLSGTFLALSDARADLATLAAVGAAPRTRRRVAAAYAVVVGLIGAVLGAAVGFVPGLAAFYPLTDVPWVPILGLVVGLPLVTAVVIGLATRSRLPLTTRLD